MKMTEHQQRLWFYMIDIIENYINGNGKNFYDLIGRLEGALDASEIKDKVLIERWYDFWTPLETRRAIDKDNIDKNKAIKELIAMKSFLINTMETN